MAAPEVNLLHDSPAPAFDAPAPPPPRRRLLIVGVVAFVALGSLLTTNVVIPSVRLSANFGTAGFWTSLRHLTFGGDRDLAGTAGDRVNVLLLGIGGAGHDGPLLTDTIIVASIQPSTGRAALLSIPRDLSIPYPDGQWRRINEAYGLAETAAPGSGGEGAARTIGTVIGVPLPYYVVVDFDGFRRIVDEVGGVQVLVDRPFADSTFPTDADGQVQTVAFEAGWQWFGGQRALQFARSRHGTNGEGSDFSRAKRQQKIILAVKDRLLSSRVLLNPLTVNRLVSDLNEHVRTNLEAWEMLALYNLGRGLTTEQVTRVALDDAPGGLLVDARGVDGAFLLQPKEGGYGAIQELARNIFTTTTSPAARARRVEVQNGTTLPGLAATASAKLTGLGFTVLAVRNADARPVERTVIYDLSHGADPAALEALRQVFGGGALVAAAVPEWLVPSAAALDPDGRRPSAGAAPQSRADYVVIVGADSAALLTDGRERAGP